MYVTDKPVSEYAKSSIAVAQFHLFQGGGDLYHAKALMETVSNSQSEEVTKAADLLKRIKSAIVVKQHTGESDTSISQSNIGDESAQG